MGLTASPRKGSRRFDHPHPPRVRRRMSADLASWEGRYKNLGSELGRASQRPEHSRGTKTQLRSTYRDGPRLPGQREQTSAECPEDGKHQERAVPAVSIDRPSEADPRDDAARVSE